MAVYYGYSAADRMAAALYNTSNQTDTTVALLYALPTSEADLATQVVNTQGLMPAVTTHGRFVPAGQIVVPYVNKTTVMTSHYTTGLGLLPGFGWWNADQLDFGYYFGANSISVNAVAVFEGATPNPAKLIMVSNLTFRAPLAPPPYTIQQGTQVLFEPFTLTLGVPFLPIGS